MTEAIHGILKLTKLFSQRPDLIQGPGGNTSVKKDDKMYIKASGFRFEEMTEETGISCVDYQPISNFFFNVEATDKKENEESMLKIVDNAVNLKSDGSQYPKPSMETGFHAVLDNYVVHTHSVWSNLINCNSKRLELTEKLKESTGFEIVSIPFVSPGFGLSYLVTQALIHAKANGKKKPEVFLLANHGIIAHSDTFGKVKEYLDSIDTSIQEIMGIKADYPSAKLIALEDAWKPASDFTIEMIKKYQADIGFFEQVLFPDQTVFFKGNISFNDSQPSRISIGSDGISYHCKEREALSIHETLTAYLFIFDTIMSQQSLPKFITAEDIDYINSMSMEKHRKSLFE